MPTESLVQRVQRVLVRYPRFDYVSDLIAECRELSLTADEPQCMALRGSTGSGKTTLVTTYCKLFPSFDRDTGVCIPVLYLWTPSPATVERMVTVMLEALGDPAAQEGTPGAKESRLITMLRACGVELIILDDFHNLIDTETDYVLGRVSNWLKALIKRTATPVLVVGLDGKVQRVLQSNSELSRLFAVRETLDAFAWEGSNTDLASFVDYVEKGSDIEFCPGMSRLELLKRMGYATNGVVGNLMNLIRYGVVLAARKKTNVVGPEMLAVAFQRRLSEHLPGKSNPFLIAENVSFEVPVEKKLSDPVESVGKRGKGRGKRGPSASSVLKA
jgi:energy-coupling factor transporter ATP-binding protein EcfA2